jgi:hypothetical protein
VSTKICSKISMSKKSSGVKMGRGKLKMVISLIYPTSLI